MLDGEVSHDQVTRLLAWEPKNSADLWRVVKPLIQSIERPAATLSKHVGKSFAAFSIDDFSFLNCHWSRRPRQRNDK